MTRASVHKALPVPSATVSVPSRPLGTHRFGVLQRKCSCEGPGTAFGGCTECKAERGAPVQRQSVSRAERDTVPPIVHEVLRSAGQPLDAATRAYMEPRFGHDFSKVRVHAGGEKPQVPIDSSNSVEREADQAADAATEISNTATANSSHDFSAVRVHTGAAAAQAARSINALAFTAGRDIVFGEGRYAPTSNFGRRLLAHELSHVIQQQSAQHSRIQRKVDPSKETEIPEEQDTEPEKETISVNLDAEKGIRLTIDPAAPQVLKLKYGILPRKVSFTSVKKYSKNVTRRFGSQINRNSMALFHFGVCKTIDQRSPDYIKLTEVFDGVPLNEILMKAMDQNPGFGMDIVGNVSVGGLYNEKGEQLSYQFMDWDQGDFAGFTKQRADTVKAALFGNREQVKALGIMDVIKADPITGKPKSMKGYETTRAPNNDATGVTIFLRLRKITTPSVRFR